MARYCNGRIQRFIGWDMSIVSKRSDRCLAQHQQRNATQPNLWCILGFTKNRGATVARNNVRSPPRFAMELVAI